MKELEIKQLITDALADAKQKMPFSTQDNNDPALAEHYFLKTVTAAVKPRLDKIEKNLKSLIKDEDHDITLDTPHYRRYPEYGTARSSFDPDVFIDKVAKDFKIPKHKLVELKGSCTKKTATPISIAIEYKEP